MQFVTALSTFDIKMVGKAQLPLKQLVFTQFKDKVDKELRSDLVYEITCQCDATYVGQNSQYVINRFKQHVKGSSKHSSLSSHLNETNHTISSSYHIKAKARRLNSQVEYGFLSSVEVNTNQLMTFNSCTTAKTRLTRHATSVVQFLFSILKLFP